MSPSKLKITLLVPCYNEAESIRQSIASWLTQTRQLDQILVVNDCSTDATGTILQEFADRITVLQTPRNTGNKSSAQEYGLHFVTGDILVMTDGDTLLDPTFIEHIERDFRDPTVAAVGGYVKSLKYNWITTCRALDYCIGQNINKLAQDYVNYMLVIPGAAGAFRTEIFRALGFDHDTLTEDLDFTYKIHLLGYRVKFNRDAICYTQDPSTLDSYINQMRRWIGGGWQNFIKHISIPGKPGMALQLSLIYTEGMVFSLMVFVLPFINIAYSLAFLFTSSCLILIFSFYGARHEQRPDFLKILPYYLFLQYVNTYIFLEQFFLEVIMRKRKMIWFKPNRVSIDSMAV